MSRSQRGGIFFKLILLLAFLAFGFAIYLARQPILRAMGNYWVVEEQLEPADAIILLSDDNFSADRAARAAELYRAGWAPRVVASGRKLRSYAGLAELMQRDLMERGVPADAVVRFPHQADNTFAEAQVLRPFVVEHGWRRILVVTSNYHTRRARYIFRHVMPESLRVRIAGARDSEYDPDRWWQARQGLKLFGRETLGMCWALWELRHVSPESPSTGPHLPSPSPAYP